MPSNRQKIAADQIKLHTLAGLSALEESGKMALRLSIEALENASSVADADEFAFKASGDEQSKRITLTEVMTALLSNSSRTGDTQILFNESNAFGSSAALVWTDAADRMTVANMIATGTVDFSKTGGSNGSADFDVAGYSQFAGIAEFDSQLIADAAVDLRATGGSSGAANLDVAGYAQFAGTVEMDGALNCDSTLSVDGLADFLSSGGNSSAPDFDVAGYAKFASAVELDSRLDVAGAVELGSSIAVSGNANLDGQLDVAQAVSLAASGVLTDIRGTLSVDEAAVFDSNVTITGDLTINGSTTTVDTTNLLVEDPFVVLAKNVSSSPSMDQGFMFERGIEQNAAIIWDESADRFALIQTTSSHEVQGNVEILDHLDLRMGDAIIDDNATIGGTLDVTGKTSLDGAVDIGDASGDAIAVLGTMTVTPTADFDGGLTIAASQDIAGDGQMDITAGGQMTVSAAGQLDLDASAGMIQLSSSAGLEIVLPADQQTEVVSPGSDSFYFKDGSDGKVKQETLVDYAAAIAGDGLAATSGILSVVQHEDVIVSGNSTPAIGPYTLTGGTPASAASVAVYINGLLQTQGASYDYTYSSGQVTLAGVNALDQADEMVVRYLGA